MAKYKFENAHDWLDSYLTRLAEANDVAALFSEAKNLALMLDVTALTTLILHQPSRVPTL
jgi:hypothetical protein